MVWLHEGVDADGDGRVGDRDGDGDPDREPVGVEVWERERLSVVVGA